jgi:hypothetical protein
MNFLYFLQHIINEFEGIFNIDSCWLLCFVCVFYVIVCLMFRFSLFTIS